MERSKRALKRGCTERACWRVWQVKGGGKGEQHAAEGPRGRARLRRADRPPPCGAAGLPAAALPPASAAP
eukprot:2558985-Pleurochrysis_carterae.AAC.2